jgi:DNA-binding CsgD family transcriptional regulator
VSRGRRRSWLLTRRTVEMHLTGAYRKLGVSSRRDLPAALAAMR